MRQSIIGRTAFPKPEHRDEVIALWKAMAAGFHRGRGWMTAVRAARGTGRPAGHDEKLRRQGRVQRATLSGAGLAAMRGATWTACSPGSSTCRCSPPHPAASPEKGRTVVGRVSAHPATANNRERRRLMRAKWFETVAVAQRGKAGCPSRCTARWSRGPRRGCDRRDKVEAFSTGLRPASAGLPATREMAHRRSWSQRAPCTAIADRRLQAVHPTARWHGALLAKPLDGGRRPWRLSSSILPPPGVLCRCVNLHG